MHVVAFEINCNFLLFLRVDALEWSCYVPVQRARSVYIRAGEHSGDVHAAGLLAELREQIADLEILGAGGPLMKNLAGPAFNDWVEDAAMMGLWEVLKNYGWFKKQFAKMLDEICKAKPSLLLLVDYPGYNLRFAKAVRKALPDMPIIYYISPQVWAWNRGRIPHMASLLDEMLCLFPFEQELFSAAGLKTTHVGHPLVDELEISRSSKVRDENLVGLFPGSREREVSRLFPNMLRSASILLNQGRKLRFEASAASETLRLLMQTFVDSAGMNEFVHVAVGDSHGLMQRAWCGVIASGTATLEAACFGLPYCLVYRVAWPTYWLGRLLVRIKYIGLVNILADRLVVRELIQGDANPEQINEELKLLLDHPDYRDQMIQSLRETASVLGGKGAHRRAATAVAEWLQGIRKN
jgi:lipid-A-disaccharide synthase